MVLFTGFHMALFVFFSNSNSKPAPELLNEYTRKVDFLKGLLEAEKLVRHISLPWKDLRSIFHLKASVGTRQQGEFILHLTVTLVKDCLIRF